MDYTLHEWVRMASHHGSIARCAIEKQAEESGLDALAVREKMRHHLRVMQEAAQQGLDERLRSVTGLTGGQAALMMKRLQAGKCLAGNLLGKAEVYALATAECNGCMGKIVAAPTAGACGILPGAVLAMMEEKGTTEEQAVDALFVAAAVGQAIATQASISGAEGGCQAECGSAAAMAAAALVYLEGGNPQQCADAAAFALMNLLGLVCDRDGLRVYRLHASSSSKSFFSRSAAALTAFFFSPSSTSSLCASRSVRPFRTISSIRRASRLTSAAGDFSSGRRTS